MYHMCYKVHVHMYHMYDQDQFHMYQGAYKDIYVQ